MTKRVPANGWASLIAKLHWPQVKTCCTTFNLQEWAKVTEAHMAWERSQKNSRKPVITCLWATNMFWCHVLSLQCRLHHVEGKRPSRVQRLKEFSPTRSGTFCSPKCQYHQNHLLPKKSTEHLAWQRSLGPSLVLPAALRQNEQDTITFPWIPIKPDLTFTINSGQQHVIKGSAAAGRFVPLLQRAVNHTPPTQ